MQGLKSEILPQRRIINFLFDKRYLMILPLALLLGRGQLARGLMPFGLPFYIALFKLDISKILVAIFILFGMITAGGKQRILTAVLGMVISFVLDFFINQNAGKSHQKANRLTNYKSDIKYAVIGLLSSLISEITVAFKSGMFLYDLAMAVLSSLIVFLLVFIFCNTIPLLDKKNETHILSDKESISLMITSALVILGFDNIRVFNLETRNIICIFVILVFSYKYGIVMGTALGSVLGFITGMLLPNTLPSDKSLLIGYYAFCGLLSGTLKKIGKTGLGMGFFIGNAVFILYANSLSHPSIYIKEAALAVCIFSIIPQKFILNMLDCLTVNINPSVGKAALDFRAKEMIIEKLNKFSTIFMEIAKTVSETDSTKSIANNQDIPLIFDRVANRVCSDCSLKVHCWDRNFYNTYQIMFKIVEKLDQKGYIEYSDIPSYFLDRCERINDFVQAVNNMYELFKIDLMWRGKLKENKNILSQQLAELSKAISSITKEIDSDANFKLEFENNLLSLLKQEGIKVFEILIIENKYGKYEVNITHKGCGGKRYCNNKISQIVSNVVGRKMIKDTYGCSKKDLKSLCVLRFIEREKYGITTGVATISKHDEFQQGNFNVSGDNYTLANSSEGKYILALSDGMGSGEKASILSKATVNLIEKFLESGLDKNSSVKLINSILMLKSNDDYFSTIDLSIIDLSDGEIEFMKIGAAPTVIKRKEAVDIVKTASLPAGILDTIEIELIHRQLNDGDMVILISDGVIDTFRGGEENEEKIFLDFVKGIKSINPQAVADIILDEAYKNSQGRPSDDMTVLVAKFWQRPE
jgi:stage II sporulation protein E